jgi:hypothetical protein
MSLVCAGPILYGEDLAHAGSRDTLARLNDEVGDAVRTISGEAGVETNEEPGWIPAKQVTNAFRALRRMWHEYIPRDGV